MPLSLKPVEKLESMVWGAPKHLDELVQGRKSSELAS